MTTKAIAWKGENKRRVTHEKTLIRHDDTNFDSDSARFVRWWSERADDYHLGWQQAIN